MQIVIAPHQPLLVVLGAFLLTFLVARQITSRIRVGRGFFSDVSVGDVHVHHVVWGVGLLLAGGCAEFAFDPEWPLSAIPATAFGIGAALVLDEFGLILYLRDVYWSDEGRLSIEAVLVMTVVLAMLVQLLTPPGRPHRSLWLSAAVIAAWIALMAVCLAKGKVFTGLAGVFVPYILLVGAVRLARPNSPWARLFYRRSDKQQRALERLQSSQTRERGRQRILGAIGIPLESPGTVVDAHR